MSKQEWAEEFVKKWAPTESSWVDYDLSRKAYLAGFERFREEALRRQAYVSAGTSVELLEGGFVVPVSHIEKLGD